MKSDSLSDLLLATTEKRPKWLQEVKDLIKERDELKQQNEKNHWRKVAHDLWIESHGRFTNIFSAREEIRIMFQNLRQDPNHHLGLGDIRMTIGQQEELIAILTRYIENDTTKEVYGIDPKILQGGLT